MPRFSVLAKTSNAQLRAGKALWKEQQQAKARERSDKTENDRSAVGDWVVANCQGVNRKDTAAKVAAQFPDVSESTALAFLSQGAFGGVRNRGSRKYPRWEREV